jgi:hypothetical protein
MNADMPSRLQRATTWLALALAAVLLALGIAWYGLTRHARCACGA